MSEKEKDDKRIILTGIQTPTRNINKYITTNEQH